MHRRTATGTIVFGAFAFLMCTPLAFAQSMQPGQWALNMRVDLDGRSESLPPVGACITQKDIDDATRTLPRPGGRCILSNVQRTPERATYDLACLDGVVQSSGKAVVTFRGDSYDGLAKLKYSERGALERDMTVTISARRTGDCAK